MPQTKGPKIEERRRLILDRLACNGQVRVSELAAELGATAVTIRSDLAALEEDGLLERVPGGAVQSVNNFFNLESQSRRQHNAQLKMEIGTRAAALVRDGETLFLNSGTTTYFTALALGRHRNLSIVTNSIAVALELGKLPTFRVILLGGEINSQYSFTYGATALELLAAYRADRAILSVDGVCPDAGLTTHHAEEAALDRIMMERAGETLVVADETKLGRESFSRVSGMDAVHCWVTSPGADPELARRIEALGVRVIR